MKAVEKGKKCVFIAHANDGQSAAKPEHMRARKIKVLTFAANPEQWFDAIPFYMQTDPKVVPKKKRFNTYKAMHVG